MVLDFVTEGTTPKAGAKNLGVIVQVSRHMHNMAYPGLMKLTKSNFNLTKAALTGVLTTASARTFQELSSTLMKKPAEGSEQDYLIKNLYMVARTVPVLDLTIFKCLVQANKFVKDRTPIHAIFIQRSMRRDATKEGLEALLDVYCRLSRMKPGRALTNMYIKWTGWVLRY